MTQRPASDRAPLESDRTLARRGCAALMRDCRYCARGASFCVIIPTFKISNALL